MLRSRTLTSRSTASPFLKWAGGKSQLLAELVQHLPEFERYYEPFLGGGALFFHLASTRNFAAHLSDSNAELVSAYRVVRDNVGSLVRRLRGHAAGYDKEPRKFYYSLRSSRPADPVGRAARLIALNKTCYNGLYRVNSEGAFNVPMGRYANPLICNQTQLQNAAAALKRVDANLRVCDYTEAIGSAKEGDFVYFDPPFVPVSSTSNFVSYTRHGFSAQDQRELAQTFRALDSRGCRVLLSNSDTPLVRTLYSDFDIFTVKASRAINCRGSARKGYTEVFVRNYVR